MARRPPIPSALKQKILYESAFACVVCQDKADDLHHIDGDKTNNSPNNIAVLCRKHHDEAHTTRELSQNLSADRIRNFKNDWCTEVTKRRRKIASASAQRALADELISAGVSWAYINHKRVAQLINKNLLAQVDPSILNRCVSRNLVDERGIIIKPSDWEPNSNYLRNTIYDWFDYGDDQALHLLYSELTDRIAEKFEPIHLDKANWTKTFIKNSWALYTLRTHSPADMSLKVNQNDLALMCNEYQPVRYAQCLERNRTSRNSAMSLARKLLTHLQTPLTPCCSMGIHCDWN